MVDLRIVIESNRVSWKLPEQPESYNNTGCAKIKLQSISWAEQQSCPQKTYIFMAITSLLCQLLS